jgi:protein TonB
VQGKVLLKFVVNTQGEIRDIEVVSKVRYGHGLEEEAIRVLKKMPRWTPGKINGKPVNVYFSLPINFRLK